MQHVQIDIKNLISAARQNPEMGWRQIIANELMANNSQICTIVRSSANDKPKPSPGLGMSEKTDVPMSVFSKTVEPASSTFLIDVEAYIDEIMVRLAKYGQAGLSWKDTEAMAVLDRRNADPLVSNVNADTSHQSPPNHLDTYQTRSSDTWFKPVEPSKEAVEKFLSGQNQESPEYMSYERPAASSLINRRREAIKNAGDVSQLNQNQQGPAAP